MAGKAIAKEYKGDIHRVITETIDYFKEINPEGFEVRNGQKIFRPSSYYDSRIDEKSEKELNK